tara:strand:+ start:74 stop:481 length:408 start_codon:yes stop_codon:yes gene_type:complete
MVDYSIHQMLASDLLEAFEKRETLREYIDPEPEELLKESMEGDAEIAHIRSLVRSLHVLKSQGAKGLKKVSERSDSFTTSAAPSWFTKLKRLRTDKRHIQLFETYAPGKARLAEVHRQAQCQAIGGHMYWFALNE